MALEPCATSVEAALSKLDCPVEFDVSQRDDGAEITFLSDYLTAQDGADWPESETRYTASCIE